LRRLKSPTFRVWADAMVKEYGDTYGLSPELSSGEGARRIRDAARIELGMRAFLTGGGCGAFTTTFENLHGLPQLPGLTVTKRQW